MLMNLFSCFLEIVISFQRLLKVVMSSAIMQSLKTEEATISINITPELHSARKVLF